ncbi:MAG: 16S rRNA (cytosine(1402)-N(4))-methyltransferase [Rhodospirillaceae bacterium]|nr:16S rRNA (cytosine(1402)-N(4))-methyltransferase [Rhodospirillaceae bacterium]|tara:strand:+ start:1990 stop:2973 length:984 start_codon:yes stop_codon:yes gene_type:complete
MACGHQPVLLEAVIAALKPNPNAIYIDATFGGGGYSSAILEATNCNVWGIDRDPQACIRGKTISEKYEGRLKVIEGKFGCMQHLLAKHEVKSVDGIMFDLGISSFQIDNPKRGFSFQHDGPLDMRMSLDGPTAEDIVNEIAPKQLSQIIFEYGEERRSRHITRAIVAARSKVRIKRTLELAKIIRGCFPPVKSSFKTIDPATRTFQALRIFLNDELGELQRGLSAAEAMLSAGGKLAVVSFHSLEDRIVKRFLRKRSTYNTRGSRHAPEKKNKPNPPTFIELNKKIIRPDNTETQSNPRARSARLRTAERTKAPSTAVEFNNHGIKT